MNIKHVKNEFDTLFNSLVIMIEKYESEEDELGEKAIGCLEAMRDMKDNLLIFKKNIKLK